MNKEEKLNEYLDKVKGGDIEGLNIVLSISKEDGSNDVVLIAGRESVIRAMVSLLGHKADEATAEARKSDKMTLKERIKAAFSRLRNRLGI